MLEKLLELFLHAKGGAITAIFVIGATGALVTATVENGVTTIVITQTTASPTGSALVSPSVSPSPSGTASASPTVSPSASPSASGTASASPGGPGCSDWAHKQADAIKKLNVEFQADHKALSDLRKEARTEDARDLLKDATKMLVEIRQAAIKAIKETKDCGGNVEDEDNDEDEDSDSTNGPLIAFSGSDPNAIAELAVSAMKLTVENAKEDFEALPTASPKPNKPDSNERSNNGKGKGRGHDRDDDEDDD